VSGIRRLVVTAAACTLALTGCGVQAMAFPSPPAITAPPVTAGPTLPTNLSSVSEAPVPGATTSVPPRVGPGGASLNGTVLGPSGPVAGATVEADRLAGDQVSSTQTTTAADGSWSIGSVLGGRYRVRAWQQPSLAVTAPQIFYLGGAESRSLTIQLTTFTGPSVAAVIAPATPVVDQTANLVVQVTNPTVGSDGVVRDLPAVGVSVTLTEGPLWQVYNGNPLPTGAAGTVLFEVGCQADGAIPLSVSVGGAAPVALQLPGCVGPPTTTTVAPPATTTTTTPCLPTITVPSGGPAATSTTLFFGQC
jgi:Carboxypeptidase regulatory-like domain